jgi:hypothetical protein
MPFLSGQPQPFFLANMGLPQLLMAIASMTMTAILGIAFHFIKRILGFKLFYRPIYCLLNENTSFGGKKTVLVAVLDWGLGHATRCIPLVRELEQVGCRVILAATGAQKALLQTEFPQLTLLEPPPYDIRYGRNLPLKLALQLPRLLKVIKKEHRWLAGVVKEYHINAVISDNRYGLWHRQIACVFMGHQLQVQAGMFTGLLQKWQYRYINRFTECWVPDAAEMGQSLAGALSHPATLPRIPVHYLGPLSRMQVPVTPAKEVLYDIVLLLSGPEPARSVFEKKVLAQLQNQERKILLVRGLPAATGSLPQLPANITVKNYLSASELNDALLKTELVICRSGYTTVMDLLKLRLKTVMVATPGQTEQLYLARFLSTQGFACSMAQEDFSVAAAMEKAERFSYRFPANDIFDHFPGVLKRFVASL